MPWNLTFDSQKNFCEQCNLILSSQEKQVGEFFKETNFLLALLLKRGRALKVSKCDRSHSTTVHFLKEFCGCLNSISSKYGLVVTFCSKATMNSSYTTPITACQPAYLTPFLKLQCLGQELPILVFWDTLCLTTFDSVENFQTSLTFWPWDVSPIFVIYSDCQSKTGLLY